MAPQLRNARSGLRLTPTCLLRWKALWPPWGSMPPPTPPNPQAWWTPWGSTGSRLRNDAPVPANVRRRRSPKRTTSTTATAASGVDVGQLRRRRRLRRHIRVLFQPPRPVGYPVAPLDWPPKVGDKKPTRFNPEIAAGPVYC